MTLKFCSELDQLIAEQGPAGLFKLNSDGELIFDLMRSRRLREDNVGPYPIQRLHCVLIDNPTKWPQYVLLTSLALTHQVGDSTLEIHHTMSDALSSVNKHKENCYSDR